MIKILESVLFFKIKRRFGWSVAFINLLLDVQICVAAGLFVFVITVAWGLCWIFLFGSFNEKTIQDVLFGTGCGGVLFFFFGILDFIDSGSFKQTILMSLGKMPWPSEEDRRFWGRKKELKYRPAPKWTLEAKEDSNKEKEH